MTKAGRAISPEERARIQAVRRAYYDRLERGIDASAGDREAEAFHAAYAPEDADEAAAEVDQSPGALEEDGATEDPAGDAAEAAPKRYVIQHRGGPWYNVLDAVEDRIVNPGALRRDQAFDLAEQLNGARPQ